MSALAVVAVPALVVASFWLGTLYGQYDKDAYPDPTDRASR
jgi:hypothetical protein